MDQPHGRRDRRVPRARNSLLLGALLSLVVWASAQEVMAAGVAEEVGDGIRRTLVKVYVSSQAPSEVEPWHAGSISSGTGSGCVIAGRRIVTAAHVVARQTYLQVRRHGETRKHDARVLFIAHEVDLALLTVDDPGFLEGVEPLALGPLPATQSRVTVLGFPTGGDTLSLTTGVVSRVEHVPYSHSGGEFLAIQVDAAVNAGNSGGPVVADGQMVGIAIQSRGDAQNISRLVPTPIVQRFLDDVADGTYDGVPVLGIRWQALENPAMRRRYGVPDGAGGVLLRGVAPGTGAAGVLRAGDVVLSIDDTAVAADGTMEFRPGERTNFEHVVDLKQRGASAEVGFVRDGLRQRARVPLTARMGQGRLVPMVDHEASPSYVIVGGVVLRPLTTNYLYSYGNEWWRSAPEEFLAAWPKMAGFEGEGLVVLASVLPDEINQGYQGFRNTIVAKVDGVRPRNFAHAVDLVENGRDAFVTLALTDGNTLVFDRAAARAREAAILARYGVPFGRSADLRAGTALASAGGPGWQAGQ